MREALGATRVRKLGRTQAEVARISKLTVDEAVARFRHHPQIEFIEPDYLYSIQVEPNDPSYPSLWALSNTGQTGGLPGADIGAPLLWDRINSAAGEVIAIIDTGVDHRHEDLAANIYVNPNEIADNGIDDDGNGLVDDVHGWDFANGDNDPDDDNGHGTHVAGIAGAVGNNGLGTVGVSWDVRLLPLKFLDDEGFGTTGDAVLAIDYALAAGVKIINASWGGNNFSNILRQAVQRAHAKGVLFVAAAGNSTPGRNNELTPFYPSSFDLPNIIAVAATDHEDRLAGFSHFGVVSVDLAAPGVDILSTRDGDTYGFLSGTSMATPHVSGALALYRSRYPEIGMAEAKALILDNVDPLDSLAGKVLTGGRLNSFRPVADPDDTPPGRIVDLRTVEPNSTRIDLEWTASGEDGDTGTATRFEVRYSTVPIDDAGFAGAAVAAHPPAPGPPGTPMRMRVTGLVHSTTYHFAIKALDEFGNLSPISNPVSGTTLGPPVVTVTPPAVEADLFTGQTAARELLIRNEGEGEYIFEIIVRHLNDDSGPATPVGSVGSVGPVGTLGGTAATRPPNAGRVDVEGLVPGDWSLAGVPGNFVATDATAANGSRYSMHGFDATTGHFNGVYQEFAGTRPTYAGLYVRSASVSTADAYFVLRDRAGREVIFFFADNTGKLYVNGDVGGNAAVPYEPLRWYHVEFKNIDFDSRTFDYHVDGTPIQSAIPFRHPFVESVERVDLYNFHGGSEAWWDEVLISTEEPPAPVSVEPSSGIVPAGEQRTVVLSFNADGLNGGDYRAEALVRGDDPLSPQIVVSAALHVTGAPDIEVLEDTLDFGPLFVGGTRPLTLSVANRGTDLLTISGVTVDHPDFAVDPAGFDLAPNEAHDVGLAFHPSQQGPISGTLTLHSNDPDTARLNVTLLGNGELPPAIEVSPRALDQELLTGQRADRTLRIDNTGYSDLEWEIAFLGATDPTLEEVRQQVEGAVTTITGLVPNAFAFLGGEGSFSITDGGEDMYDTGNFISTNLGSLIQYSNGSIRELEAFGPGGRYFTRKHTRLFFFAADMQGVGAFAITGNLGADGAGAVDGTVLRGNANGIPHLGFVKRVFGAANPSVNHLIVVAERPGIAHDYSTSTNSDFHVVTGLADTTRLYYLLYASRGGGYIDDATTQAIFQVFLRALDYSDVALDVAPIAGRIPAGQSAEATISFDATGLSSGEYASELAVISNDPVRPAVPVSTRLVVIGAPDITVAPSVVDFRNVFVGASAVRTVVVSNDGAETLNVVGIVADDPGVNAAPGAFEIASGSHATVAVTFAPSAPGALLATLTILSDDPDEPAVGVALRGAGLEPPRITLDGPPLAVEIPSGTSTTRALTVGNASGSDLVFTARVLGPAPAVAPTSDPGATVGVRPARLGGLVEPAPVGAGQPPSTAGGETPDPVEFTFRDDFEDGDLAGWLGPDFGRLGADSGSTSGPAEPVVRTAAGTGAPDNTLPEVEAAAGVPFSAEPQAGRLAVGETVDIVVTFDAHGLVEGTYGATLAIESNDPGRSDWLLPLTLSVVGEPDLGSSRDTLAFGVVHVGLPQMRPFTLTNFGSALLTIDDIAVDDPDFTVNSTAFALAPGQSRSVNVTFAPVVAGPDSATLTIRSNSPRGDFLIQLSGEGRFPPAIDLSAGSISGQLFTGQQEIRGLTLSNLGGEALQFSATVLPSGGSGPPQEILVFRDNVELGPNGWTAEVYGGDDLWHRSRQNAYSPEQSWACNIEGQGDYASPSVVSTAAISPPIDLRGVQPPVLLTFFESYETERIWDQCMVDISDDGGASWTPLRGAYGSAPSGSSNGWIQSRLLLSNYAGKIVRLRFYFETLDATNNQLPGWFVDDVSVTAVSAPWLTLGPLTGVLAPGQSEQIEVRLDAAVTRPLGVYSAVLRVASNDPFQPLLEVPISLAVLDPPRVAFPGDLVTLHSSLDYATSGRTTHAFILAEPPAGPGEILLAVEGDFGGPDKTATASAEAVVLGRSGEDAAACGAVPAAYPLSANQLQGLAADGVIAVDVRNSPQVAASCPVNRHDVTLTYPATRAGGSFGTVFLGGTGSMPVVIANNGGSPLNIESIGVDHDEISLVAVPAALPPGGSATLWLAWTPAAGGALTANLSVHSSDPFRPAVSLPLTGLAAPSAQAQIAQDVVEAALPPGSDLLKLRSLRLANVGQADLHWNSLAHAFADVQPAAGVVAAGGAVDLTVRLSAADLAAGDHTAPLLLETDDPNHARIEIPLLLHVGEVRPDRFEIDFTPRFATVGDTVEVSLQLPAGLDPAEVVVESIALFDQLAPLAGQVAFHDLDLDGILELIVQFDREAFEERLPRDGDPQASVSITGEVEDRTWFRGIAWPRGVFPVDPLR